MSTQDPEKHLKSTYEAIPYAAASHRDSNPAHFSVIGKLFSVSPAPIETARVLEIGCATGANLSPLAYRFPKATFVGIDLSEKHIQIANKLAEQLALTNITYHASDFQKTALTGQTFDYIICHGLFSWISAQAQNNLIPYIEKHLSPRGIGYVSYNVRPGWNLEMGARTLMQFHARDEKTAEGVITKAREAVSLLADQLPETSALSTLWKDAEKRIEKTPSWQLLHDHLETFNTPIYFYEFAGRLQRAGLRYLGDALFSTMQLSDLSEATRNKIQSASNNQLIPSEQYTDFFRNRSFRQSLFVKKDTEIKRAIAPGALKDCYLASTFSRTPPKTLKKPAPANAFFDRTSTLLIQLDSEPARTLLTILEGVWPKNMPYDTLLSEMNKRTAIDDGTLAQIILELYSRNVLLASTAATTPASAISERPRAFAPAKAYAQIQERTMNMHHQLVVLDKAHRSVLQECTGNKTLAEIAVSLEALNDTQVKEAVATMVSYGLLEA